ncbi:MAG: hypothetical protein NT002_00215 [candidate division Zixibacteria bacterium]|nr:hypothetical protein [candidate division Zixibacteria bacterium]
MANLKIAFWNLQNLFDTKESVIAADFEFTPKNGWTDEVYEAKLKNLAQIIKLMHKDEMPDILGFCEIENKEVVTALKDLLPGKDYKVAYEESEDIRGIGTALIYSGKLLETTDVPPVGHKVYQRYPTRDVFEVPLKVKENGAELIVMVNHWPSRSQGQYESEPFRLHLGDYCGRLIDGLLKYSRSDYLAAGDNNVSLDDLNNRWNSNILLMGDFNDEPFNRSVLEFLKASNGEDHIEELFEKPKDANLPKPETYLKKQAYLFNCMWPQLAKPDCGTYYYSESPNTMNLLDQFIVSRGLYYGAGGLKMNLGSVEIFKPKAMCSGKKLRPKAFKYDEKGIKVNGYSDHFPIQATIDIL